jgi:hypothetical protein
MARPRSAHRLECYSPKLGRRLRLYNRPPFECWLQIESNPLVVRFCERPGHLYVNNQQRLIDFWVCFKDREEFWLIELTRDAPVWTEPQFVTLQGSGRIAARQIRLTDILAWQTWTHNWERMLPYMSAARSHITPSMKTQILATLTSTRQLSSVETALRPMDAMLVRAALFTLVHEGVVTAPSLYEKPLSWQTRFSLTEAST